MTSTVIPSVTTNMKELNLQDTSSPAGPCIIIIFGAAGDLTKRKLVPALYNLKLNNLLPQEFAIVGIARSEKTDDVFREEMTGAIKQFATTAIDNKTWDWFAQRLYYLHGHFEDPSTYVQLKDLLKKLDSTLNTQGNYLYYLATAEDYFESIIEQLAKVSLNQELDSQWRHVIIEKPFGKDLQSANELNRHILSYLKESQIYRIDHYLGKETVQNLMVFRFGNSIFEPAWNSRYIDHVQITVAESVGIETRGGFYEKAGALRDMVPNHLFQLLSLIAMEPPSCFSADAVRDKKTELMMAIRPLTQEEVYSDVVRGQYGEGFIDGQKVKGYRSENRVAPDSNVETFVAMKLMIDNERWANVPFYLRTGKALHQRVSEIAIQFKHPPFGLFRDTDVAKLVPNFLIMHIQPDEGITLQFGAKVPGPKLEIGQVGMEFRYNKYFGAAPSTGYETLIYDCMIGDPTLFNRADNVEAGWKVVEPIQKVWEKDKAIKFPNYTVGSWGPVEAMILLERDKRRWRLVNE